eukprot:scaffold641_cov237-Pinguiococcus_pyrenoidosus.AAC.15
MVEDDVRQDFSRLVLDADVPAIHRQVGSERLDVGADLVSNVLESLLLREDAQGVGVLQARSEEVLHLRLRAHQLHNLLVALQPHGLEHDEDGHVVTKGVVLEEHASRLDEDVGPGLALVRAGDDGGTGLPLPVQLDDDPVLRELLVHVDDLLDALDHEVASGVEGALLHLGQFRLALAGQQALARAQHDGDPADRDLLLHHDLVVARVAHVHVNHGGVRAVPQAALKRRDAALHEVRVVHRGLAHVHVGVAQVELGVLVASHLGFATQCGKAKTQSLSKPSTANREEEMALRFVRRTSLLLCASTILRMSVFTKWLKDSMCWRRNHAVR